VSLMCEQCTHLQQKIIQFNRALKWPIDPLTTDRLQASVAGFEQRIALLQSMHDGATPVPQ